MLTAIGKFSKSFFVKLLVGIIIIPFVFWGMGDVFRGGNQNVIATVDTEKISTQEFLDHLRRFNLNQKQIKDLPKSDLVEKVLSVSDFMEADEVFMSGNMMKVTSVSAFEDRKYEVGPLTKKVREMYWDWALSENN